MDRGDLTTNEEDELKELVEELPKSRRERVETKDLPMLSREVKVSQRLQQKELVERNGSAW